MQPINTNQLGENDDPSQMTLTMHELQQIDLRAAKEGNGDNGQIRAIKQRLQREALKFRTEFDCALS